jgi:aryl-alcohol dehydrogenase-like predicted oxidoreductase
MDVMQYNLLGKTGLNVSRLSFGASSLSPVFHPVDESQAIKAVHAALDCGINYFDVAPAYGGTVSETVLGKALRAYRAIAITSRPKSANTPTLQATAKTLSIIHATASESRSTRARPG